MRELKFRAWSKKHNKYLKITGIQYDDDKIEGVFVVYGSVAGIPNTIFLEAEDVILEQYTGLKDKNGKEIYEGDIIHRGALSKANVFRNSVICFDEESVGFIATSTRNGVRTLFNGHTCDEVEVIGNIHENPELLKW